MKLFKRNQKPNGKPDHRIEKLANEIMQMPTRSGEVMLVASAQFLDQDDLPRLLAEMRKRGFPIEEAPAELDKLSAAQGNERYLMLAEGIAHAVLFAWDEGDMAPAAVISIQRAAADVVNDAPASIAAEVAWTVGNGILCAEHDDMICSQIADPGRAFIMWCADSGHIRHEGAPRHGISDEHLKIVLSLLAERGDLRHPKHR